MVRVHHDPPFLNIKQNKIRIKMKKEKAKEILKVIKGIEIN